MGSNRLDHLTQDAAEVLDELPQLRLEDAWKWVLGSAEGRIVIRDILMMTNFGTSAFGGNADLTLMNSGKQAVGEGVMDMINRTSPDSYFLMTKEAKENEEYDRHKRDERGSDTSSGPDTGTSS